MLSGCSPQQPDRGVLFERLSAERSGIHFSNTLHPTEDLNAYLFRNFYNGGGVAIGDVDNDGWKDVFFTGNQVWNRLFHNKGDGSFEDITESAGISSEGVWATGVSMADVNGDGWLDIYVCKSGPPGGERRHNELFVNNKDGTFTEKAGEYGLDVTGLSIHAAFFDYDLDGDLDLYLLSNPIVSLDDLRQEPGLRYIRDPDGGNRLFRNEQISLRKIEIESNRQDSSIRFIDVTEQAGIYSSRVGFGLGVSVADVNRDGWPDLYVSNDFFERDYLYINQQNGSFEEMLPRVMGEISLSSMGGDIADLNNDGFPEIFVSDMLPSTMARMHSKITFASWSEYMGSYRNGYHYQATRNTLQLNRGPSPYDSTALQPLTVHFGEIGRFSGIEATGWSWGGLFADFDNDGHRDLFVPNGIYKELLDQDFIEWISNPETLRSMVRSEAEPIMRILEQAPSTPLINHMFAGHSELRFKDTAVEWGLDESTYSNGSAYGDLDNDGDLDLVLNNVNMEAFVYLNQTSERYPDRSWLQVDLEGRPPNTDAFGAQVTAWAAGRQWYVEQQPIRGFQSSMDPSLHLGFGSLLPAGKLDSLVVKWPGGELLHLTDVRVNQRLSLRQVE